MNIGSIISADTHVVKPPDMYVDSIEDRLRDSAPRIQRRKTPNGKEYDAWFVGDLQVGQLGAVVQAGKRFEDPSQIDQLGVEDVPKAGYDPHYFVKGLEEDGVWGALVQPSQGLFWYRMPDSEFLSAMCRIWNDWIAAFCQPYPTRLKGVGCLNVDDVSEAVRELDRCKRMVRWRYSSPYCRCQAGRTMIQSMTDSGGPRRTSACPCSCTWDRPARGAP